MLGLGIYLKNIILSRRGASAPFVFPWFLPSGTWEDSASWNDIARWKDE
jgi:hypothetical protein